MGVAGGAAAKKQQRENISIQGRNRGRSASRAMTMTALTGISPAQRVSMGGSTKPAPEQYKMGGAIRVRSRSRSTLISGKIATRTGTARTRAGTTGPARMRAGTAAGNGLRGIDKQFVNEVRTRLDDMDQRLNDKCDAMLRLLERAHPEAAKASTDSDEEEATEEEQAPSRSITPGRRVAEI